MEATVAGRRFARFGLVLVIVLGLLAFNAPRAEAASSTEKQMASYINKARANHGRAGLAFSYKLSQYARKHSATMAAKNRLYHNPKLAKWLSGYDWNILGENVGVGPSIHSLHKAFMASPGHRANNLDKRFKQVGVGVVWKNGRVWITIIFKG
jgi:uncharacterized protein YkwD